MAKYTVKEGDTLNQIAQSYGYKDYAEAGLTNQSVSSGDVNLIRPGEQIEINQKQPDVVDSEDIKEQEKALKQSIEGAEQRSTTTPNTGDLDSRIKAPEGPAKTDTSTNGGELTTEPQVRDNLYEFEADAKAMDTVYREQMNSYKTDIGRLSKLTASDLDASPVVIALQEEYEKRRVEEERYNSEVMAGTESAFYRRGGLRYQVASTKDIINEEERKGIERLEELKDQYDEKIAEAKQALLDENYDKIAELRGALRDTQKDILDNSKSILEQTRKETAHRVDIRKKELDYQSTLRDIRKEIDYEDAELFLVAALDKGIDDPNQLFLHANFDEEGNKVRNVSMKEINDLVQSYNKTIKSNGAFEIVGTPSTGIVELQFDKKGRVVGRRTIVSKPKSSSGGANSNPISLNNREKLIGMLISKGYDNNTASTMIPLGMATSQAYDTVNGAPVKAAGATEDTEGTEEVTEQPKKTAAQEFAYTAMRAPGTKVDYDGEIRNSITQFINGTKPNWDTGEINNPKATGTLNQFMSETGLPDTRENRMSVAKSFIEDYNIDY